MKFLKRLEHNKYFHAIYVFDPGLRNIYKVTRTVLTVITNIFVIALLFRLLGQSSITQAPLIAGLMGLLPTFAITDPIPRDRKITLLLAGIFASIAIVIGTLLTPLGIIRDIGLLLVVFLAFYLRKFGQRFMPLGMISFMGFYFTFFVPMKIPQLPFILLAVFIGISFAFLYMFVFLPERPSITLRALLHSWDVESGRIFEILKEMVNKNTPSQQKKLKREAQNLTALSSALESQLGENSVELLGKKVSPETMRVYFFDSFLAVTTLTKLFKKCFINVSIHEDKLYLRQILVLIKKGFVATRWDTKQKHWSKAVHLLRKPPESAQRMYGGTLSTIASELEWLMQDMQAILKGKQFSTERESVIKKPAPISGMQPSTTQAIQGVIAVAGSMIVASLLPVTKPYWIIITAFVVLANAGTIGRAYDRALLRTIGTFLGAVFGFGLAILLGNLVVIKVIVIFISIYFAFFFFQINYALMSFGITIMLALLYDLLLGGIQPGILEARVLDTLIGSIIGLAASFIVFPKREDSEFQAKSALYLRQLEQFIADYVKQLKKGQNINPNVKDAFILTSSIQDLRLVNDVIQKVPGYNQSKYDNILTIIRSLHFQATSLINARSRNHKIALPKKALDYLSKTTADVITNIVNAAQYIENTTNKYPKFIPVGVDNRDIPQLITENKYALQQLRKLEHINLSVTRLAESF